MNQNLADLVKKKAQAATSNPIDWDDRRNKYLAAVSHLYRQIEDAFREAIADKSVVVHRRPRAITESYLGTYTAEDLVLVVGNEQVRFSPRGRNIAGAAGRVDVLGERGEAILLFQPDSGWEFVQTRQPALRTVPFDESALAEVMRLVMRD